MKTFSFETTYKSKKNKARLGIIHTPHGDIETPAFVPVGTQASVKALVPEEIKGVGTQIFFVNTYHMAMRPGIDLVERFGGLHTMMQWSGPIITDSGGFQVFSLARQNFSKRDDESKEKPTLVKINEEGVTFRSHWDGAVHEFNPEVSMEYQWKLGSDIHIAFDDCTPYPVTHDEAKKSMERTHRWAVRSLNAHNKIRHSREGGNLYKIKKNFPHSTDFVKIPDQVGDDNYQALYGSIQGSIFEDLRRESATFISSLDTDGIAIGGVSVGETKEEMKHVVEWVVPYLPDNKPRHLLGVGEIDDIFMLIEQGLDTFDCTQPTRHARAGYLYSHEPSAKNYLIDISKQIYNADLTPVDASCSCYTCQTFTKAYVHHLFKVRELLAYRLATIHNLAFIHSLVNKIKQAILQERLEELKQDWL